MISRLFNYFCPKDKLAFVCNQEGAGEYGKDVMSNTKVYKHLRCLLINPKYRLLIKNRYDRHFFPVVDADNQESMVKASMWLKQNAMDYTLIESSPNHYWFFLNYFVSRSQAKRISSSIPGNDSEFIKCGNIYIRGQMKEDQYFVPILIEEPKSKTLAEFTTKLIDHFKSEEVKWAYNLLMFKSDQFDMSNPKSIDVNLTLSEVIKGNR